MLDAQQLLSERHFCTASEASVSHSPSALHARHKAGSAPGKLTPQSGSAQLQEVGWHSVPPLTALCGQHQLQCALHSEGRSTQCCSSTH